MPSAPIPIQRYPPPSLASSSFHESKETRQEIACYVMDGGEDDPPPPPSHGTAAAAGRRCPCACPCCGDGGATKRKRVAGAPAARVGPGAEACALREALAAQQAAVRALQAELEEERSAAASAASEAMSMILRLQRERADALMESRQFRRLAEERMAHDQHRISALEDLLFRRDQSIQALSLDLHSLRHRLLSFGLPLGPLHGCPYPPLCCGGTLDRDTLLTAASDDCNDADASDKYVSGETPRSTRDDLDTIDRRIHQLECNAGGWMEKGVVGRSPRRPTHLRGFSTDSLAGPCSPLSLAYDAGFDTFPLTVDRESENGDRVDDMSDRVYTVDAVHGGSEDYVSTPRELVARKERTISEEGVTSQGDEVEIKKLYARLQALEADRESMRQAIVSMGTDKAQALLLREIAQQLCKEAKPEHMVIRKESFLRGFSIMSALKWVMSFVFWRKKASRIRYTFGLSSSNVGLLLLLDKSSRMRQQRFLTGAQR